MVLDKELDKGDQKILMLVPHFFKKGGVVFFYKSLVSHFVGDYLYFQRGNRSDKHEQLAVISYLWGYVRFLWIMATKKIDFVVINTSLGKSGCYRDAFFIRLLQLFGKKFMVFFHGWNKDYEHLIDTKRAYENYPFNQFMGASGIIVLSQEFKDKLQSWGYEKEISLGTTFFEEDLIKGFELNTSKFNNPEPFRFLFLSRIEKEKGIIEAIRIFDRIQKANPDKQFVFRVGGKGGFLKSAKKYVTDEAIENVAFLGHLEGEDKTKVLKNSHFFLFPSYGEGMPLAVLEAMAFGLPIMATAVGGLRDIFQDKKMGVLLEDLDLNTAFNAVQDLILDEGRLAEIARFNHEYALKHFRSSEVAQKLERMILTFADQAVGGVK